VFENSTQEYLLRRAELLMEWSNSSRSLSKSPIDMISCLLELGFWDVFF
jgi:hypothetical protein